MKKTAILLAACFAAFLASAQNTTIHATIPGLAAGQWIYYSSMGDYLGKDSVQTVDGGFTIRLNTPPGGSDAWYVRFGDRRENAALIFFAEPGTIEIKGPGPNFKDAALTGEPALADYTAYKTMIETDSLLKDRTALFKKANDLYKAKDSAGYTALLPQIQHMEDRSDSLTLRWIAQHPASHLSAWFLSYQVREISLAQKDSILKSLTADARNNAPAKRIAESVRIDQLTGIGRPAPDFTQNDTAGHPVSLKDFRGKYVLIDFWASWCGPCRAENPNVVAAYGQFHDKKFTVLGVSLDQPTGKEKWLKAIHDDHLTWTQVSDLQFWNNAVARKYDIGSIPANILVGPDGTIVAKSLHGEELTKKLTELLP